MSSIREARAMFETAWSWHQDGQPVALLTLVGVKGSAYRRPGAKMVMALNGHMQGTLSGGCLEGDLFGHAEQVLKEGTAQVAHYDLTEDEMWGLGIGCKGQVDIWIEPLDFDQAFWSGLKEALAQDQTVVWGAELPSGSRYYATPGQTWTVSNGAVVPFSGDEARGQGQTGTQDGYWWDVMRPPERLVLAGAGHDARPVAQMAAQAGFDVIVLDPREHVNNAQYFPNARHLVMTAADAQEADVAESYWVIMNHHQRRDQEALERAQRTRPKFVGVLGPRSRTDEMLASLGLSRDRVTGLRSPVGLDLGAESPEEVAISIVSELMAARSQSQGGPLDGKERIHR